MVPLITVFKFMSLKREILFQTADAIVMNDIFKFSDNKELSLNQKIKLNFDGEVKIYEVVNFIIYPYVTFHTVDEYIKNTQDQYTCEQWIYLKEA